MEANAAFRYSDLASLIGENYISGEVIDYNAL